MTPTYEAPGLALYLGDCLEIMPRLERVDHVITDPPYGEHIYKSMRIEEGRIKTPKDLVSSRAMSAWTGIDDMIAPLGRHFARIAGRWVLVFSDIEMGDEWRCALGRKWFVRSGAWVKPYPMPQFSGDRPAQGFELCSIFHQPGRKRWNGGGKAAVWVYPQVSESFGDDRMGHPCPKPLPLMLELVELFTDPGETIFDPFMGSGTTGAACLRLGRKFIGIEKDPTYFETAKHRLIAESQGQSLRQFRAGQLHMFPEGTKP